MQISNLLKSSGLAALALAIALPALSVDVAAQERPQRGDWRGGNGGGGNGGGDGGSRNERRAERQAQRNNQPQPQAQAPQPDRTPRAQPPAPAAPQFRTDNPQAEWVERRVERQAERAERQSNRNEPRAQAVRTERGQGRDWQGRDRGQVQPQPVVRQQEGSSNDGRDRPRVIGTEPGQTGGRDRDRDDNNWGGNRGGGTWNNDRGGNRDRDYRDNDRDGDYRDNNRDRDYRDNDRDWNRDHESRRDDRRDHRRWDRRWRDDHRYDWNNHRRTYRNTYHLGRYYSPYRDYSYRRLSIGFYLDRLFFGSRYWISDPWQYRLPDVYGPYRWVRYYDDVLLVATYTGEVVDVIYDFYW